MRRLTAGRHGRHGRHEGDERGVIMILVSVFVVAMMAMAALAVDVGSMVHERRELQNGADAVALSVAHSCALGEAECDSDGSDEALGQLADGNAVDDATTVQSVEVDKANRTVTVRTRTRSASGDSILPFNFAQVFSGKSGETLHATSVATWGAPLNETVVPWAMSVCEWEQVELDVDQVTIFHSDDASGCDGPAGQDIPGGFGWLDPDPGTCTAALTADGAASAKPGAPVPSGCDLDALLGKQLLVPVFDRVTGTGTNAQYHVAGFASFTLNGYLPSTNSNPKPCNPPKTSVSGVFTHFVQNTGGPIGGPDFGVSIVELVS